MSESPEVKQMINDLISAMLPIVGGKPKDIVVPVISATLVSVIWTLSETPIQKALAICKISERLSRIALEIAASHAENHIDRALTLCRISERLTDIACDLAAAHGA